MSLPSGVRTFVFSPKGAVVLVAAVLATVAVALALRAEPLIWLAWANSWLADTLIRRLGYWGVFLLMFIESSLIPFPSEIVIPPAGDLARRLPEWDLLTVIVLGTAGSLGGALFNYGLALLLGRPLLLRNLERLGRYVRLSREGYDRAEAMFLRHGAISTFTGRLIPGIRQIVSLPAGLARMNLLAFCLLTSLGAGLWVAVLALAGYWFGGNAQKLEAALGSYALWLAGGAAALVAVYAAAYRLRAGRKRDHARPGEHVP